MEACRDPTVGSEFVNTSFIYIVGKRGIFTHSPLLWIFCPLLIYFVVNLVLSWINHMSFNISWFFQKQV